MKVVLSGIFYPMAILRYFQNALERRSDIELVTIGPYTGRWIPWAGGMNLLNKYERAPDIVLPRSAVEIGRVPIQFVQDQLPWKPDLWIEIDAGFYFTGRPTSGVTAIVGTDPHVLDYHRQRLLADHFFCMQKVYARPKDVWLPYAYDPVWHAPLPDVEEVLYDAVLIGIHYFKRDRLVAALRELGIRVACELGVVFEEARALYAHSHIGLNWSSRKDLNARVFETMAMGLPLVTNNVPDMGKLFTVGKDYLGFERVEGAVTHVELLLKNPQFVDAVAQAGQAAVKPHTYDARVNQILEVVFDGNDA